MSRAWPVIAVAMAVAAVLGEHRMRPAGGSPAARSAPGIHPRQDPRPEAGRGRPSVHSLGRRAEGAGRARVRQRRGPSPGTDALALRHRHIPEATSAAGDPDHRAGLARARC